MTVLSGERATPTVPTADALEAHRPALLGFCYRMLGSAADADDAVQETMVRAWRGLDRFEGRAPLEAWLYRIATNVCLNLLRGRSRRALPMDLGPASSAPTAAAPSGRALPGEAWVEPMPDAALATATDPAEVAASRESVRLAFVAALQLLPPRQRAALILHDVLRWRTEEVATLLDTTVVSVKSALQRARATLADRPVPPADPADPELLDRYLDAFRRYDIDAVVRLLRDDATLTMPPQPLWLRGPDDIRTLLAAVGSACSGAELEPLALNGTFGAVVRRATTPGGPPEPYALHVVESVAGRITAMHVFRDAALVERAISLAGAGAG
jgi:RNA polymerase sigma-70 factor (ECF subfamily)